MDFCPHKISCKKWHFQQTMRERCVFFVNSIFRSVFVRDVLLLGGYACVNNRMRRQHISNGLCLLIYQRKRQCYLFVPCWLCNTLRSLARWPPTVGQEKHALDDHNRNTCKHTFVLQSACFDMSCLQNIHCVQCLVSWPLLKKNNSQPWL